VTAGERTGLLDHARQGQPDPAGGNGHVSLQVIGEDSIVAAAGAQGNFELNAMRPIIINNVLHSARILGDAAEKLRRYSIDGTELDQAKVEEYVGRSLMLVTALSPYIGYDKASADRTQGRPRRHTATPALALGVSAADFDRIVDPNTMVGNPRRDLVLEAVNTR
jgi:fumarate hydratase, class II